MSTSTLGRITLQTMANYRAAAQQIVSATGAGGRRVVRAVDQSLQARLPRPVAVRIDGLRSNVSGFALKGIDQIVERGEQVIATGSEFAVAQVSRWNDFAADVDNRVVADGLDAVARLSLPAAQLALAVSSRVADGASALASAAGAKPAKARRAVKARTAAAAKPATARKAAARRVAAKPARKATRATPVTTGSRRVKAAA